MRHQVLNRGTIAISSGFSSLSSGVGPFSGRRVSFKVAERPPHPRFPFQYAKGSIPVRTISRLVAHYVGLRWPLMGLLAEETRGKCPSSLLRQHLRGPRNS